MSAQSEPNLNASMCSVADFPVRISAAPVLVWGLRANGLDFGDNSIASFASFDRATSLWRTRKGSLLVVSAEFLETWPASGMTRSGHAFKLPTLARPINEKGSFLLPTPTRSMGKRGWGCATQKKGRYSLEIIRNALLFGWRPPVWLLEWMMGYPRHWTAVSEQKPSGTASFRRSRNGSPVASSTQKNG